MIPGKLTRMRAVEPADLSLLKEIANDRFVASLVVGWSWPLSDYGQGKWWEGAHNSANTKRFMVEDFDGSEKCIHIHMKNVEGRGGGRHGKSVCIDP